MTGWRLFRLSISLAFSHFWALIRKTRWALAIWLLAVIIDYEVESEAVTSSLIILELIIATVVAVTTHRHLLLDDKEEGFDILAFWRYLWKAILLVVPLIPILVGIELWFEILSRVYRSDFPSDTAYINVATFLAVIIISAIVIVFLSYLFFARLSVCLPAAAVGDKLSFRQTWKLTGKFKRP